MIGLSGVDVGHGWLIYGLPPAEIAVHPGEKNDVHELYLMCDDVEAFVAEMQSRGVACSPVQALGWGMLTQVELPGGGRLGVYQPRHARPKPMRVRATRRRVSCARNRKRSAARKPEPQGSETTEERVRPDATQEHVRPARAARGPRGRSGGRRRGR